MNSQTLFWLRKRSNILFLLLLLFSCEDYEDIVGYKEYKIKEGNHGGSDTPVDELNDHALVLQTVMIRITQIVLVLVGDGMRMSYKYLHILM
jgi:hypothetical protein